MCAHISGTVTLKMHVENGKVWGNNLFQEKQRGNGKSFDEQLV